MHALLNSFFFFCKPTGKPTDSGEHSARQKIPRQKIASGLYIVIVFKSCFYYPQALVMIWYMPFVLTTKPMHAIWCHSQSNACHLISRPNQWMPLTASQSNACHLTSRPIQCMPFNLTVNPMHAIWSHSQSNSWRLISRPIQCMSFDLTANLLHAIGSHVQSNARYLISRPI